MIKANKLDISRDSIIVEDEDFALKKYLMKPFSEKLKICESMVLYLWMVLTIEFATRVE